MHASIPRLCALALSATLAAQGPYFSTFGTGCPGTMPASEITMLSPPVAGSNLQLEINNLPDNAAWLSFGFSNTTSSFGPLPRVFPVGSNPGCTLYMSPDFSLLVLGANNVATFSQSFPAGASFVGLQLYYQALAFDSAHVPDGFAVSDAVEVVVGEPGWPLAIPVNNMQPIADGSFQMGSPSSGYARERPVHTVDVTEPFWIGRYEVTQAEYQAVMGNNPSFHQGASFPNSGDRPVERVTWDEAMAYCAALTEQESAAGRLPEGYQYRLPTEAEWEYCCRAGTTTEWSFGGSVTCAEANYSGCVGETQVVGTAPANPWGLHEMHGNVYEWCLDSTDGSTNYPSGPVADPFVTSGSNRIFRGGGWSNVGGFTRSAFRGVGFGPSQTSADIGFRVVLAPRKFVDGMVPIASGAFQMGSPSSGYARERPVHTVDITESFWIGRHEVTQDEYQSVMGSNPSFHQGASYPGSGDRPVESVTWNEAMEYCAALTAQEQAAGRLPEGYQYRLPTEAEWEYCCRAGTTTEWSFGSSVTCAEANYSGCVGETQVVGTAPANPWGLHEMHGNVYEWCLDSTDGSANYPNGPVSDPFVTSGSNRIFRGGGWSNVGGFTRSAFRGVGFGPSQTTATIGFRVVLAPKITMVNMVEIASGVFQMGSTAHSVFEQPVHSVNITEPFWMGRYEVTQDEYRELMGSSPSGFQGVHLPVETVLWSEAMAYCAALTAKEASAGRLPDGYQYRLPTEAEWEYCCRAGTTTEWNTGATVPTCAEGNFLGCEGQSTTVGSYAPNAWGLYDMHGNVGEWCLDAWDQLPNYPMGLVVDPYVASGTMHLFRGGAWNQNALWCRSAIRYGGGFPQIKNSDLGFRVVLAPRFPFVNMVSIASGSFQMGSLTGTPEEQPVHQVNITQPFWIGKYEVMQAEYEAVMGSNPSRYQGPGYPDAGARPVESVSWHAAVAFCDALSVQEAAAGRLPAGYEYRLPSEAEWEYCCRATTPTDYSFGNYIYCQWANFHAQNNPCRGETRVVGSYSANPWGIFDMHGNAFEWCLDSWDRSANYPAGPVSDPYVTTGLERIARGGSCLSYPTFCRSSSRSGRGPSYTGYGFRVVLAPILP